MTNHVAIVGELVDVTRERVTKLRLDVPERRKDKDTGEWGTVRMPVEVTVFGDRLNAVVDGLAAGQTVAVLGKVSGREFKDRCYLDLVASDIVASGEAVQGEQRDPTDDIPF